MARIRALLTVQYDVEVEIPDGVDPDEALKDDVLEQAYANDAFSFQTPENHWFDEVDTNAP